MFGDLRMTWYECGTPKNDIVRITFGEAWSTLIGVSNVEPYPPVN